LKLYFMRHGKAEEKKPGMSDEERKLSDEGRREVEFIVRSIDLDPEIVYTSPLLRSIQTAEIVAQVLGAKLIVTEVLHPSSASLGEIKKLLAPGISSALFVGHSPSIENIIRDMTGGCRVSLDPAAVAALEIIDVDALTGMIKWIATPRMFRRGLYRLNPS